MCVCVYICVYGYIWYIINNNLAIVIISEILFIYNNI